MTSNPSPNALHARNGSIGETPVHELLLGIEQSALDARLWVDSEYGSGEVLFHKGLMVKASLGGARAQTALLRLLDIAEGRYGIEPCSVAESAAIVSSVVSLLEFHDTRKAEWKDLCSHAPPLGGILRLTAAGAEVRDSARGIQRVILVLIDSRRTLMQVLEESSFDPVDALRIIVKALDDDLAQLAPQLPSLFPPAPPAEDSGVLPRFANSPMTPVQDSPSAAGDMKPPSWRRSTLVGLGSKAGKSNLMQGFATPIIDASRPGSVGRGHQGSALVKTILGFGANAAISAFRDKQSKEAPRQRIVDVSSDGSSYVDTTPGTGSSSPSEASVTSGLSNSATGPRRFVDRYEILLRIGRGGMGTVYLARLNSADVGFRRLYALKLLLNHLSHDAQASKDFLDEARVAGCLHHANVVAVCDAGFHGKQPYLVMEYVEGCSFKQLMHELPHRPPSFSIPIIIDALAGLHAAHTLRDESGRHLNLVHCDVSPENLLVGIDGTCRLSDFGMVREANCAPGVMARGKPGYIAPERIAGEQFDHRADIFSVGVVLWEALTGKRLFRGNTVEETIEQVCNKQIEPPSSCGAVSTAALDAVVMKALARNPNERFQSAEAMLTELDRAARAHDGLAMPKDIASWVRDAAGPELTQRRLAILDASRTNPTVPPAGGEVDPAAMAGQRAHRVLPASVESNKSIPFLESSVPPPRPVEGSVAPPRAAESIPSEPSSSSSSPPSSNVAKVASLFYGRKEALRGRATIETPEMVPHSGRAKNQRMPLAASQRGAWMLVVLLALAVGIILLVLSSRKKPVSHTYLYWQGWTQKSIGSWPLTGWANRDRRRPEPENDRYSGMTR